MEVSLRVSFYIPSSRSLPFRVVLLLRCLSLRLQRPRKLQLLPPRRPSP